jgi:hypothetical protein
MAGSRIKEITIEIDGDTTKLTTALKKVDKQIRDTQSSLQDVNKLLKMDPGNADLLAQKQNILFAFFYYTQNNLLWCIFRYRKNDITALYLYRKARGGCQNDTKDHPYK